VGTVRSKMIICRHKYDCFWLDPKENNGVDIKSTAYPSTEFLVKSLDSLGNLFGLDDKLSGEIYQGYDPKELDQNVPAFSWIIEALPILKERIPGFDDAPDVSNRNDINGSLLKTFIIENKSTPEKIRKESLQVLVDKDGVIFHRISCVVADSLKDAAILANNMTDRADTKCERLFSAEFFHYIGSKMDLEKFDDKVRPVGFNKLKFRWDMDLSDPFYYKSNILSEQNEIIPDETLKEYSNICLTVSEFLNKICNLMINKSKVHYEDKILRKNVKEISDTLKEYEIRIERIKENLKSTFSPTIPPTDFYTILGFYEKAENGTCIINTLVNTCKVNKKHFKNMSEYYLKFDDRFDKWAKDSMADLDTTMTNIQTNVMHLRDRINIIKNNIELLITMGTHDISLYYSSELIVDKNQTDSGSTFSPMIDVISNDQSKGFKIFRPMSIKDANFDNLTRHYLEALYLLSENDLEFIVNELTKPDRFLAFAKQFPQGELECLGIGKFLNEYEGEEKPDTTEFLKKINCIRWDKNKRCQLKKILKHDETEPGNEDYQRWVSINSMVSLFEAMCTLFKDPKHHAKAIENKKDKKKYFLMIAGLLCFKTDRCEKAQKYFSEAIVLAHKENKFDWAFSVAQIAGLCENSANPPEEKKGKLSNKDIPFRTKLASYFLDVFDLQKAIDITRSPDKLKTTGKKSSRNKPKSKFFKCKVSIRTLLFSTSALILFFLIFSSYLIYNNGSKNAVNEFVSRFYAFTWIITSIGAPVTLFVGIRRTWRKRAGKLVPQILYPKYLSVITITVITFSFSGKLIVSLASQINWPIISIFGILCILTPVIYLGFKWNKIIDERIERFKRIVNFLSLMFLEACTLSSICMLIYGPTFENKNPQYIIDLYQSKWLYFSPIFILLASLVAVLFGVVFKEMLGPTGPESD